MLLVLTFLGPIAQLDRAAAFDILGAFAGKQKPVKWTALYRWTLRFVHANTEETFYSLLRLSFMNSHHTKTLGDLGVLKAQVDLYQKGYWVSIPLTEHAPFDLVITKNSSSRTVQVKARKINSKGSLEVPFRQSYSTRNGVQTNEWDKSEIDIVCVYCPDLDECFYFDPKAFNKTISLRVKTPKNNQKQGIHFVNDYREVP